MIKPTFPNDFLWGGALSNVQAEGAIDQGGKGQNVFDILSVRKEVGQRDVDDSSIAANHYYQYKEDIALMKEMGFKAYRFSIVWSRIHPQGIEEKANEEGLAFYEDMIDELLASAIEPIVSLVHFDMPAYLTKKYNGFYSPIVIDHYIKHVKTVVARFKGKVKHWITFNEINLAAPCSDLVSGALCPDSESQLAFYSRILRNTQIAHARAVLAIKELAIDANVSGMIALRPITPETTQPNDIHAASIADNYTNYLYLDIMYYGRIPSYYVALLKKHNIKVFSENDLKTIESASKVIDYISISYYRSNEITAKNMSYCHYSDFEDHFAFTRDFINSKNLPQNQWGWSIDPVSLHSYLTKIYTRYHKPIFIVENGIGLADELDSQGHINDDQRIQYYHDHIKSVRNAIFYDGVALLGYLAWSPLDFLSSHKEMRKRYGFIYVDNSEYPISQRIPKKSFYWYKNLIKLNGDIYER